MSPEEWDTACHEAAHAVLAWHSDSAVVTGVALDDSITYMMTRAPGAHPTVTMAGELSCYLVARRHGPDWAYDLSALSADALDDVDLDENPSDAQNLYSWLMAVDPPEHQRTLDQIRAETIRLLDEHSEQVALVARELMVRRHLDADDLADLLGPQEAPWWDRGAR